MKSLTPTELKRLHRTWRRKTELSLGVILDGVQSPFNVGSLFRSAAAYKTGPMWLVPPTPDPGHTKVAKTALGCERLVDWKVAATGVEAVAEAQALGMTTVAIELTHTARPMFEIDLGSNICLVLGHEERGVHPATLDVVDHVAFLPQLGKVGSLNVSQAGTVALYEAARQQWAKS